MNIDNEADGDYAQKAIERQKELRARFEKNTNNVREDHHHHDHFDSSFERDIDGEE